MTIDPHENASVPPEGAAINPYAPPAWENTNAPLKDATATSVPSSDVQAVPDPDFWAVSFLIIGLLLLAWIVFFDWLFLLGLIALISFIMGVFRVCFVYSRRARAGLCPLPYGQLLFTSTLISCGILICSAITFFTTCMMTLPIMSGPTLLLGTSVLLFDGLISLIVTIYLFIKSFDLSMMS